MAKANVLRKENAGVSIRTSSAKIDRLAKASGPSSVWDSLDSTLKDVKQDARIIVRDELQGIAMDARTIIEKKDSIANHLLVIHFNVGKDIFSSMASNVFPRLGLSRSSTFRLLASAQLLKASLPVPEVRGLLLERTDKSVTTTDKQGKVILNPNFKKALAKHVKDAPKDEKQYKDATEYQAAIDTYTANVLTEFQKLGKPDTKGLSKAEKRKKLLKERFDSIQEKFGQFLAKFGPGEATKLLNYMEEMLEAEAKTIEAPKKKAATATK